MPDDPTNIQLPQTTAWPMVLALGLSLIFAGMVTSLAVGILGLLLTLAGIVRLVPSGVTHEQHVSVPVEPIRSKSPAFAPSSSILPTPPASRRARSSPSKPSSSAMTSRAASPAELQWSSGHNLLAC